MPGTPSGKGECSGNAPALQPAAEQLLILQKLSETAEAVQGVVVGGFNKTGV